MHKITIKNKTKNSARPTYVSIDGQRIRAKSVNFNQSADRVPICEIEIPALPDIEALANIQFRFGLFTVEDAVKVLRHNLMQDKILYNAFVSSIESALKEIPEEMWLCDVAKAVADRIIGEK